MEPERTSGFDLDRLGGPTGLKGLVDEVVAAGELALRLAKAGAGDRARRKADQSPVTEADEAVEKKLRSYIEQSFPAAAFVGEESGTHPGEPAPKTDGQTSSQLRFIVDPIDGTRAFIRGLPTWSVLLAVEADGQPVVGIAFMPQAGDLMTGVSGQGAQINGRPAQLSTTRSLNHALVAHGGLGQFAEAERLDALSSLARHTHTQRGLADFANYRELLLGRADAVVDPAIQLWDIAPAAVLVREAGGQVTTFDGTHHLQGGNWVASNGQIHKPLLELLQPD